MNAHAAAQLSAQRRRDDAGAARRAGGRLAAERFRRSCCSRRRPGRSWAGLARRCRRPISPRRPRRFAPRPSASRARKMCCRTCSIRRSSSTSWRIASATATRRTFPTANFFYGLQPGDEIAIEIERGKTLIVRYPDDRRSARRRHADGIFRAEWPAARHPRARSVGRGHAQAPSQGGHRQPESHRRADAGQDINGRR